MIYVISVSAVLRQNDLSYTVDCNVSVFDIASLEEAHSRAKILAFDSFPPSEGWKGHAYKIKDYTGIIEAVGQS